LGDIGKRGVAGGVGKAWRACHDAPVDTVEWGSGGPARTRRTAWRRAATATAGNRTAAAVLAVLGFAALVAAEVLPWTSLHISDTAVSIPQSNSDAVASSETLSSYYNVGLHRLDATAALAYHFGLVLVLGLVGAALMGRPAHRRTALGLALGALAAQIIMVVGLVHSFHDYFLSLGLYTRQLPPGFTTSVDPGAFCAFASLALLLAALLISALPAQVRTRLVAGPLEPADERFTDTPADLTVTPVNPIDESYFSRPQRQR
jgi:hypothetical protein